MFLRFFRCYYFNYVKACPKCMTDESVEAKLSRREDLSEEVRRKLTISLPADMLYHLVLLGKTPIFPRLKTLNSDIDIKFSGTHLGDELNMLDVMKARREMVCTVLFPNGEPIEICYKGELIQISPDTFDEDIQWLLMTSDIGKAGTNAENCETVAMLFNDILINEEYSKWISEHRQNLLQICSSLGIQEFDFANSGNFSLMPIALAVHITSEIAKEKGVNATEINRVFLDEEKVKKLQKIGIDPKKTSMRELWDSHLRFGEEFLDSQTLGVKESALARLALCHHLSQGNYPKCLVNGELELSESGVRIAVFLEVLDKLDAFINRSGFEPQLALDNVKNAFDKISNKILNGQREIDIKNVWRELSKFDWIQIAHDLQR